jgi:uncharacterized membrane protein
MTVSRRRILRPLCCAYNVAGADVYEFLGMMTMMVMTKRIKGRGTRMMTTRNLPRTWTRSVEASVSWQ